jgi:hypothetical protein
MHENFILFYLEIAKKKNEIFFSLEEGKKSPSFTVLFYLDGFPYSNELS